MTPLHDWLLKAAPDDIVHRIEAAEARATVAENDAFRWHVAVTLSAEAGEGLRTEVERVAGLLREGGYEWPPL